MLRRFITQDSGGGAAEFALVAVAFFVVVFGIIDFARLMWEMNAATTATQKGVRYAVVHDYVSDLYPVDGFALGYEQGQTIPADDTSVNDTCSGAPSDNKPTCEVSNKPRTVAFDAIREEMAIWYDGVDEATVVVSYESIGLGFTGDPHGSDVVPLVTVRLENLQFNLVTPIVSIINPIELPAFSSSLTGEDGES